MIQTAPKSILWDVTDAQYYADHTAISWSTSEIFRESPAKYCGMFVKHTIPPQEPSPEMILGSLVHTCVLEPETIKAKWLAVECKIRNGKAWEAGCQEAKESGKTAVPVSWIDDARRMAEAVWAHPVARWLLKAKGLVECPLRWVDPATGLLLKSKLDRLVMPESCPVVVDLKTCPDPSWEAFARRVNEFGYYRQSAWYLDAAYQHLGQPGISVLIAVGKEPPYDVWTHQLPPDWLALGAQENRELLNRMRLAFETNQWFAPGQMSLNPLPPPRWKQREIDNLTGETR